MQALQTIAELAAAGEAGVAVAAAALERAVDGSEEARTTFTRVYADEALHQLAVSRARLAAGRARSPLEGVATSIKDLFDVAGETTRAGSAAMEEEPAATEDAAAVARLRAAGAVLVGRTNMTQFALSCLGLNPDFGTPLSPWRTEEARIAGGSSSGAATSVAHGMATAAIGTDTGGSVRVPASFCGLVGFKPTAARVDRRGAFSLSRTLDSIGPIAHSAACCAAIDAVLSGDPPLPVWEGGITLAVPVDHLTEDLDAEVASAFSAACSRLSRGGVRLVDIAMPELADIAALSALGGFSPVEGWADHAALFDRIGDRCDPRVMDRFRSAAATPVSRYFEMLSLRADIIRRSEAHRGFDAIIHPTVAMIPPRLADLAEDDAYYAANARAYRIAGVANILDRCAISIPCHAPGDAPVGLTLMGANGGDAALLSLAMRLEATIRGA